MSRSTTRTARLTAAATTAVIAAALAGVGTAHAQAPVTHKPQVLVKGLISPLSAAAAPDGTRYYSQSFTGQLYELAPGGKPKQVFASAKHDEVGALSEYDGAVTFAVTGHGAARLKQLTAKGKVRAVADLGKYEKTANPDHVISYGFDSIAPSCAKTLPKDVPVKYHGLVDSHPYASVTTAKTIYVADAAGNDILSVSDGKVSTVAVLPGVSVKISAAGAKANKLPDCVVGKTYKFESVPTDVELGPDGNLYVTTLPGGPEDASLGANAQVLKVVPGTGKVSVVASGLISATGLAVGSNGDIFVSELFAGKVAKIKAGTHTAHTFLKAPFPSAVEITKQGLLLTENVLSGLSGQPGDKPAGELVLLPY